MSIKSSIEWTDSTWNPVTGCSKISAGCRNCYAEKMARRLKAMRQPNYARGFQVTTHVDVLDNPLKWKKPQNIFVNSMSDLFHEDIPDSFIFRVFNVMNRAAWHRFQVLTKRSNRLEEIQKELHWTSNIWIGVSVENSYYTYRINSLRNINAAVKFVSFEPLIAPVGQINLEGIDWVIVGGESGPGARPLEKEWVTEIKNQCHQNNVPFFFKQWGGFNKKKAGRLLEGRTWDEMPRLAVEL